MPTMTIIMRNDPFPHTEMKNAKRDMMNIKLIKAYIYIQIVLTSDLIDGIMMTWQRLALRLSVGQKVP